MNKLKTILLSVILALICRMTCFADEPIRPVSYWNSSPMYVFTGTDAKQGSSWITRNGKYTTVHMEGNFPRKSATGGYNELGFCRLYDNSRLVVSDPRKQVDDQRYQIDNRTAWNDYISIQIIRHRTFYL